MKNSDKKSIADSREPAIGSFGYDEFFNNQLALPPELKEELKSKGLVWRFINAAQFRSSGNVHRSHWKPYKVEKSSSINGLTVEGLIQRGDLVLAVREKKVAEAHKKFLDDRNKRYSGFNKEQAREMKKMAREYGVEAETKVYEGYEDND